MRGVEAFNIEREVAGFEAEMARKYLETQIAQIEDAIRMDTTSLLACREEIRQLEQEEERLRAQFPASEAGVKAILDHMKKMDGVRDKLNAAKQKAGKLVWALRARYSDLQTAKERAKEFLPPEQVEEIKFPAFTAQEEAWFKEGEEMTKRWETEVAKLVEAIPFTPEEEAWFAKGEKAAA